LIALLLSLGLLVGQVGTVQVGGLATWYQYHEGQAAAGPTLRSLLGPGWRGDTVTVSANGHHVTVRLTDWCACGDRNGKDTLIDLDDDDFAKLAPTSRGVIEVAVEFGGSVTVTLPPTDTVPDLAYWLSRVR
jgi:hypothetical protein